MVDVTQKAASYILDWLAHDLHRQQVLTSHCHPLLYKFLDNVKANESSLASNKNSSFAINH